MAMTGEPVWYCLACGAENQLSARFCRQCGRQLAVTPRQQREGAAFLLNELEALREEGAIDQSLYLRLRERYRQTLTGADAAAAPATAPPPSTAPPGRAAAPEREGPGWLAEQQANLLLYLGAFLITIATMIFVSRDDQAIGDNVRMAALVLGTLFFLGAGLACMRFPRVWQAGVVFVAVGALMVPLNFVGAYAFFFADEDIDPTGLWLAGSLTSAIFYGAVSMLGLGRWYPVPAVVAVHSALAAILVLADAPPEAYPGSFIALALLLTAPSTLPLGRASAIFGTVWSLAAHAVAPVAILAAELKCDLLDAFKIQVAAAKELAPYMHAKQPVAISVDTTGANSLILEPWGPGAGAAAGDGAMVIDGRLVGPTDDGESDGKSDT